MASKASNVSPISRNVTDDTFNSIFDPKVISLDFLKFLLFLFIVYQ